MCMQQRLFSSKPRYLYSLIYLGGKTLEEQVRVDVSEHEVGIAL